MMGGKEKSPSKKIKSLLVKTLLIKIIPLLLIAFFIYGTISAVQQNVAGLFFKAKEEKTYSEMQPFLLTGTQAQGSRTEYVDDGVDSNGNPKKKPVTIYYYDVSLTAVFEANYFSPKKVFELIGQYDIGSSPNQPTTGRYSFVGSGLEVDWANSGKKDFEKMELTVSLDYDENKFFCEGKKDQIAASAIGVFNPSMAMPITASGFAGEKSCGVDVEGMVSFMEKIAADPECGYDNTYNESTGSYIARRCYICNAGVEGVTKDFDCNSLVCAAIAHSGLGGEKFMRAEKWGGFSIAEMRDQNILTDAGFKRYEFKSLTDCRRGDILFWEGHVEVYCGAGVTVGARQNRGCPSEGDQPQQQGRYMEEIMKSAYGNGINKVICYFRYEGTNQ